METTDHGTTPRKRGSRTWRRAVSSLGAHAREQIPMAVRRPGCLWSDGAWALGRLGSDWLMTIRPVLCFAPAAVARVLASDDSPHSRRYSGWCQNCRSPEKMADIRLPYACKLLFQVPTGPFALPPGSSSSDPPRFSYLGLTSFQKIYIIF